MDKITAQGAKLLRAGNDYVSFLLSQNLGEKEMFEMVITDYIYTFQSLFEDYKLAVNATVLMCKENQRVKVCLNFWEGQNESILFIEDSSLGEYSHEFEVNEEHIAINGLYEPQAWLISIGVLKAKIIREAILAGEIERITERSIKGGRVGKLSQVFDSIKGESIYSKVLPLFERIKQYISKIPFKEVSVKISGAENGILDFIFTLDGIIDVRIEMGDLVYYGGSNKRIEDREYRVGVINNAIKDEDFNYMTFWKSSETKDSKIFAAANATINYHKALNSYDSKD